MSGGRCAAHRPWRLTSSFSGVGDLGEHRPALRACASRSASVSSGMISSRTNARIQSSFSSNSGSVSKSHAIVRCAPGSWSPTTLHMPCPAAHARTDDADSAASDAHSRTNDAGSALRILVGMDHVNTVLTVAVLGFMGVRLAGGVRHARTGPGRALTSAIVRGIRWRHVWPVPFVLTGVLARRHRADVAPGPALGLVERASAARATRCSARRRPRPAARWSGSIPIVFLALLVPALPLFAHAEELHLPPRRRALVAGAGGSFKVVQFGMAHALIGIPIGAALALSVGGAYFMAVYLAGDAPAAPTEAAATIESARAHTVYNADHRRARPPSRIAWPPRL